MFLVLSVHFYFSGSRQVTLIRRWWLPPSWPHCPHHLWCITLRLHPQVTPLARHQLHSCTHAPTAPWVQAALSHTDSSTVFNKIKDIHFVLLAGDDAHHKSLDVSLPWHRLSCWRVDVLTCIYPREGSRSVISTLFHHLSMHVCLPKPSTYCQLFSLDHFTTAPFAVSSVAVVAITMPTTRRSKSWQLFSSALNPGCWFFALRKSFYSFYL